MGKALVRHAAGSEVDRRAGTRTADPPPTSHGPEFGEAPERKPRVAGLLLWVPACGDDEGGCGVTER